MSLSEATFLQMFSDEEGNKNLDSLSWNRVIADELQEYGLIHLS